MACRAGDKQSALRSVSVVATIQHNRTMPAAGCATPTSSADHLRRKAYK